MKLKSRVLSTLILGIVMVFTISCEKDEELPVESFAIPSEYVADASVKDNFSKTTEIQSAPNSKSEDACDSVNLEEGWHYYVKNVGNDCEINKWFKIGKGGTDDDPTSNMWTDLSEDCQTLGLESITGAIRWNETWNNVWTNTWSSDGKRVTIDGKPYVIHCQVPTHTVIDY